MTGEEELLRQPRRQASQIAIGTAFDLHMPLTTILRLCELLSQRELEGQVADAQGEHYRSAWSDL